MVGVLKSPCASSHTTATWLCRRWSPAIAPRPTVQSPDSSNGLRALATASATARFLSVMRSSSEPAGTGGQASSAPPAGTGKAGMRSSRCHGAMMRSQPSCAVLSVLSAIACLASLALREQVEQPLQFVGAGPEVSRQLRPGLRRFPAQRLEQFPVIVCGAAEFAAGALGERQGEALLLLELCVEALQPGASGGPDEGCVEEPVAVEHGRDVAAAEGVLDLVGQLREPAVHGRVARRH